MTCPTWTKWSLKGFTLIEVLVVVAIIGLLTGVGLASYNNFNEKQRVQQAAMNFAQELRKVQKQANAGERKGSCTDALISYTVFAPDTQSNATTTALCLGGSDTNSFDLGDYAYFATGSDVTFTFKPLNQGLDSTQAVIVRGKMSNIKYKVTAEAGGVITVVEEP